MRAFFTALLMTTALLAPLGCGGAKEEPPPPAQKEPTALELAEKELHEMDAELKRLYVEHSQTTDPATKTDLEQKLRAMELKRRALNEEVMRLAKEAREQAEK
ncbi:hypothetical protein GC173_06935 [bacterium]|nr:hypothetical protein [bacterium]